MRDCTDSEPRLCLCLPTSPPQICSARTAPVRPSDPAREGIWFYSPQRSHCASSPVPLTPLMAGRVGGIAGGHLGTELSSHAHLHEKQLQASKTRKFLPTAGRSFVQLSMDASAPLDAEPEIYAASSSSALKGGRNARYGSAADADDEAENSVGTPRSRASSTASGRSSTSPNLLVLSGDERIFGFPACCPCLSTDDSAIRLGVLARLARLALPSVLAMIIGGLTMLLVNVAAVGHASNSSTDTSGGGASGTLLAGVALGAALMLLSGWAVVGGMCSSIDTLCSQAHGAGKQRLVGLIAQRVAISYTILVLPPIAAVWIWAENILLWAGQDPTVSAIAGSYTRASLPVLAPLLYSEIIRRYLLAQSGTVGPLGFASLRMALAHSNEHGAGGLGSHRARRLGNPSAWPQIVVALLANAIHALLCGLALWYPNASRVDDRGFAVFSALDAAGALVVGMVSMLLLWLIYLLFLNRRLTKQSCPRPVSKISCARLWRGWGPLLRLGIPGLFTGAGQAVAMLVALLLAGWMHNAPELDCIAVLAGLASVSGAISAGVGLAAGTLVGRSLGSGRPEEARHVARASGVIAVVLACVESVPLLVPESRLWLASVFSVDPAVQAAFMDLSLLPAALVALDCCTGIQAGLLRGMGRQSFAARATLLCYGGIGLPLAWALAFPASLGARGLALGLVVASAVLTVAFAVRLSGAHVDWDVECLECSRRLEAEEGSAADATEQMMAEDSDLEDEGEAEMREERRRHGFQ